MRAPRESFGSDEFDDGVMTFDEAMVQGSIKSNRLRR
jgi:hypothetical protein